MRMVLILANLRPRQDYLGAGDLLPSRGGQALGDCLDLRGVDQQGQAEAVVPEGGVGRDQDVLILAVLHQLRLGQARMALNLVDSGYELRVVDNGLELDVIML